MHIGNPCEYLCGPHATPGSVCMVLSPDNVLLVDLCGLSLQLQHTGGVCCRRCCMRGIRIASMVYCPIVKQLAAV